MPGLAGRVTRSKGFQTYPLRAAQEGGDGLAALGQLFCRGVVVGFTRKVARDEFEQVGIAIAVAVFIGDGLDPAGIPADFPAFMSAERTALSRLPNALWGRDSRSSAPSRAARWQVRQSFSFPAGPVPR